MRNGIICIKLEISGYCHSFHVPCELQVCLTYMASVVFFQSHHVLCVCRVTVKVGLPLTELQLLLPFSVEVNRLCSVSVSVRFSRPPHM